jgi:hypothetical protein
MDAPQQGKSGQKPGPKPTSPARTASAPVGSTIPPREAGPRPAGREAGKLLEPLSGAEARRGVAGFHRGAAKLIGSKVDFQDADFDQAGDALKDVADRIPAIRLVLRIVAPVILVGALVEIWRRILAETPWWQRLREGVSDRQRRQAEANAQAQATAEARAVRGPQGASPAVPVSSPGGPGGPGGSHHAQRGETEPQETAPALPARGPALRGFGGRR